MMRRLVASKGVLRLWQENDSLALLEAPIPKLREVLEQSEERSIPDGSVWTFNVVPDNAYGLGCNFDFDTFGILKVSDNFKDWRLRVINLPTGHKAKRSRSAQRFPQSVKTDKISSNKWGEGCGDLRLTRGRISLFKMLKP